MSRTMPSKSAVASGWNTIAALPAECRPMPVSIATCAVLIANRRSGAGFLSSRLPRKMSRNPTPGRLAGEGALELRLQALEAGDARLERRVRGEDRAELLARAGREDVERRELGLGAQVALRDPAHAAGDLHQRAGERARAAGDDRRAAVGRELPVARQRLHKEERDHVHADGDEQQDHRARVVVVVRPDTAEEEAELHD